MIMIQNKLFLSSCLILFMLYFLCAFVLGLPKSVESVESSDVATEGNQSSYSLSDLYKILEKSVVQIDTYDSNLGPLGLGSGFIYDTNGYIVTNQHVVEPPSVGTLSYDVIFTNGAVYGAKFIGADPFSDLAVLHIENASGVNFAPLKLGNSSAVKPGEDIAIFGSAEGLIGTLTKGVVSAVGRSGLSGIASTGVNPLTGMSSLGINFDQPEFIQTDAAINHGNSGGPAVNMNGEVIGVSDLTSAGKAENINFLIPSDTVKRIVPSLISNGVYRHPWLGLEGIDMTSSIAKVLNLREPKGFLVVNVDENGPAFKAGVIGGNRPVNLPHEGRSVLLGGDVIVTADSKDIRSKHDLLLYLESKKVGQPVELSVVRDGSPQQITVILGERPALGGFS
jgi:S1-C subfamily serine protease